MSLILNEEQKFILDNIDKPMQVSAGAGSGKTRVLVERYYKLLCNGAGVNNIMAVTFTRKAAGEMKERIRKRIAEDAALPSQLKSNLQEELAFAFIGTIHSICARLIRENPLKAGVDPYFGLMDEVEAYKLKMDIIRQTVYEHLEKDEPYLKEYIKLFGFEGLLYDLYEFLQITSSRGLKIEELILKTGPAYTETQKLLPQLVENLKGSVAAMNELIGELKKGATRKKIEELVNAFPAYVPLLEGLKANPSYNPQVYESLQKLWEYKPEARGNAKESVNSFRENLAKIKATLMELKYLPLIKEAFLPLAVEISNRTREAKEKQNLLEFDDLEEKTLAMLKNNPDLLQKYRQQFKYIMVDEFQDTNYRQAEIFRLLSGDFKENIFMVGDPKQSIYRFRGAKVELFGKVGEKIGENGINAGFNRNYRTLSPIIDFINHFFNLVMENEKIPFAPLLPERSLPGAKRSRFYLVGKYDDTRMEKEEVQAYLIADIIKDMTNNEEIRIQDEKTGAERAINYGDIALLFRTTANMHVFARIFKDYGIPCHVAGSRDFFMAEEIEAMLKLLEAVAGEADQIALIGVLRSFFFRAENETLWILCKSGENMRQSLAKAETLPLSEEEKQKLARAYQILSLGEKLKKRLAPSELIRILWDKSRGAFIPLKYSQPAQKAANINKLADMAYRLEEKGIVSLNDFLAYVNEAKKREVKEKQANIELEAENRVKLMTVHQSKGLEFPVVIIPELEKKFNEDDTRHNILVRDEEGVFLKLISQESSSDERKMSLRRYAEQEEKRDLNAEYKRLFYVALTRSRDLLIFTGIGKTDDNGILKFPKEESEPQSWLDFILMVYGMRETGQIDDTYFEVFIKNLPDIPESAGNTDIMPSESPVLAGEKVSRENYIDLKFDYISPTRITEYAYCSYRAYFSYQEGVNLAWLEKEGEGTSSAGMGNIVHYLAEKAESLADAKKIVENISQLSGDEKEEALNLFENYLKNKPMQKLINETEYLREVPFLVKLDDIFLRGIIDGLGMKDDKVYIVDLKTGQKREIYNLQLAAYQEAIAKIMPDKETEKLIFYLKAGEIEKLEGKPDLNTNPKISFNPPQADRCSNCGLRSLCGV